MSEIQEVTEHQTEAETVEAPTFDEAASETREPSTRVMCCDQAQ
jgi:hypothetical protein